MASGRVPAVGPIAACPYIKPLQNRTSDSSDIIHLYCLSALILEEASDDCGVKVAKGRTDRHWIALKESGEPEEATRPRAVLLSALGGATAAGVAVERHLVSNTTSLRCELEMLVCPHSEDPDGAGKLGLPCTQGGPKVL